MRIKNTNNSGFTLLEITIAILIFIIIITSTLMSLNRSLSLLQTARDQDIALSDLRDACEDLRRQIDNAATITPTSYGLANINTTETVTIAADTSATPIPVTVTVSWQAERARSMSVSMLLIQREDE